MDTSKTIKEVELAIFSQSLDGMVRNREESRLILISSLDNLMVTSSLRQRKSEEDQVEEQEWQWKPSEQFGYVGFEESVWSFLTRHVQEEAEYAKLDLDGE